MMTKKLYSFVALAMMALTFTSCDSDDSDLAYDLNGVWQGVVQGDYYRTRYGSVSNMYDTEVTFYQEGAFSRGGTGYWIDVDVDGRSTRTTFNWRVRNQNIYIEYDDGYKVVIRRDFELYELRGTPRFRGYLDDYYTGETIASFNFVKIGTYRSGDDGTATAASDSAAVN